MAKATSGLLNEHEVARIVGLSVATVRRWRLRRQGPRFIKIGTSVRYDLSALESWLRSLPTDGGKPLNA
jgi:predicted DNA-binding transcriptional regulator AlpA